ncbi:MAG TPA: hypothetical protein VNU68_34570, partial [Verrucomicrobiae bacterium]|nr:hypothetical protein [Verrucomicrobiae bacterium]
MNSVMAIRLAPPAIISLLVLDLFAVGLFAADTNELRRTPVQRMQPDVLKATHEAVQRFARERVALPDLGAREDFRAVIHVHA